MCVIWYKCLTLQCLMVKLNMKKEYKNLLFDLGGVILDLKRSACVEAFKKLGLENAENVFGEYSQTGVFLALEEGLVSPEEFRAEVRTLLTQNVTDDEIDDAFGEFLVGIPLHRLKALEKLREDYRIYLLSNTNPIHINKKIKEFFGVDNKELDNYFDGKVLSYLAKASKPNPKIFEYTINHLGIKPEETLFLDDSQRNLDAASKFGFGVALVEPGTEFVDVLKSVGVIDGE